jgi:hypothetical protein
MPTPTMDELIAKLEGAVGGTTRLDYDIYRVVTPEAAGWLDDYPPGALPRYTTSLDAALSLVPDGWGYTLSLTARGNHPLVKLYRSHPVNAMQIVEGRTMPVTLCIAAMKARAAISIIRSSVERGTWLPTQ